MFVRSSWSTYKGKRYQQFHLVESYRDPETGKPRHRLLMNLTRLPPHVIEAIRQSLKMGTGVLAAPRVTAGDALRGAGLLAVDRAWRLAGMNRVLAGLSECEQNAVQALVTAQILDPGRGQGPSARFQDSIWRRLWPGHCLEEDQLCRVMNILSQQFHSLQERFRQGRSTALCLYCFVSTFCESEQERNQQSCYFSDGGWDCRHISIGLVCDDEGMPRAVEVWPHDRADPATLVDRVMSMERRFAIEKVIFVGDLAQRGKAVAGALREAGFDYVWRLERPCPVEPQKVRIQPEPSRAARVVEWEENGVRYLGCVSAARRERAAALRETGLRRTEEALNKLAARAASGRKYSWNRLDETCRRIGAAAGIADLWRISLAALEPMVDPNQKVRLKLEFAVDQQALEVRRVVEGRYVLETSLPTALYPAGRVDRLYRELQEFGGSWYPVRGFLRTLSACRRATPIRAHVLIYFLAFYFTKAMEREIRKYGETKDMETVLRDWDRLCLVEMRLDTGSGAYPDWQWSAGTDGLRIRQRLEQIGWWSDIDQARALMVASP